MTKDSLSELVERQRIKSVLIEYCTHLDQMELPALGALFTEDCRVIYGDSSALRSFGRAALETSLARMWRWQRTAHHLSNIKVNFQGDVMAHAESYVLAWHEAQGGHTATLYGRYLDRFVKQRGRWQIAERRMEMNGSDSGFRLPLAPSPRTRPPEGWQVPEGLG